MFEQVMSLFQSQSGTPVPVKADAQHALGALLVQAAKADRLYIFEEIELIDEILAHRFKLNPSDAAVLRQESEMLDAVVCKTPNGPEILRDAIAYKDRAETILSLWEVVFADGRELPAEEELLHRLETLFGVPTEKSRELRALVKAANP